MLTFVKIFMLTIIAAFLIGSVHFAADGIETVGNVFDTPARFFLSCPIGLICILYFLCICKRHQLTKKDAIMAIIGAAIIESVLAILALLIPSAKEIMLSIMRSNIDNATISRQSLAEFRLFGFAKDLFDHFGYGMGIIAALPVYLAIKERKVKYALLAIPILVAIILNARTGIVVFGVILILFLLGYLWGIVKDITIPLRKRMKKIVGFLCISGIVVLGGMLAMNVVYDLNPKMKANTIADFSSVFNAFLSGSDSVNGGVGAVLFSESFWQLPQHPAGLLVGEGHSAYGASGYAHSDVGYVNDIWFFGLIGCLVFYGLLTYYALRVTRPVDILDKMLMLGVVLAFFIFQIKGTAFWSANLGALMTLTMIFLMAYYNAQPKADARRRLNE